MSRRSLLIFFHDAYARGSGTAVVESRGSSHRHWCYREIVETAARFARKLRAQDVGRGDPVLFGQEPQ